MRVIVRSRDIPQIPFCNHTPRDDSAWPYNRQLSLISEIKRVTISTNDDTVRFDGLADIARN